MGERQTSHFGKRFKRGLVVVYPERPLEGAARRMRNQKILEAVKAVLTGILKRDPTPDELSGCTPIARRKRTQVGLSRCQSNVSLDTA
jgi:hypothetical protein